MTRWILASLVAGAVVALFPCLLAADSGFRCESGRLVGLGDHMYEVQKKCGDPDFAGQRTEKRKVRVKVKERQGSYSEELMEEREVEILLDEWTYDFGPTRFIRNVVFENGRVIQVGTGGYGTRRR